MLASILNLIYREFLRSSLFGMRTFAAGRDGAMPAGVVVS